MTVKSLKLALGSALLGLSLLGPGNANALSPAEEFEMGNRFGGLESVAAETSGKFETNSLPIISDNGLVKKTTHKPYTPKDMMWDETTFIFSESVQHTQGSEVLDEVYSATASIRANFRGIWSNVLRKSDWGSFDKFFLVPEVGAQVMHKNLHTGWNELNPSENSEPAEATKTYITWPMSLDARYYFKDNLYCGLLFRHKSSDEPREDTINLEEWMTEHPGNGIVHANLNIMSYDCAYKSSRGKFEYQARSLLNVWQTLTHPAALIRSNFESNLRADYPNLFAFDGRVAYNFSTGMQLYMEGSIEFPKNYLERDGDRAPMNLSLNLKYGMLGVFYEISRGRPDGLAVPDGFTTDSNNNKAGIKLIATFK